MVWIIKGIRAGGRGSCRAAGAGFAGHRAAAYTGRAGFNVIGAPPGWRRGLAAGRIGGVKWLGCMLLVLAGVSALGGCRRESRAVEPLVVGMELAYPPFEMTDEGGNPTGVSVDMARALAESMGRELVVRNIPFTGLISSLKTGKIDLIISSLTVNEERARSIDFSDPYVRTGLGMLVGADSGVTTIGEADRDGRVVVVNQGTTGHSYAVANLKRARVKVLDKEQNCVMEVVQGRADAFVYDQMSIYQNWRRHPERTRAVLKPFQEESWAIGIRKGDLETRRAVNRFLAEYRRQGGFERLSDAYLTEQKKAFREMGIPFVF